MGLRYIFQILRMVVDIVLIAITTNMIYTEPFNPLNWFLIISVFLIWHKEGGFIAWKKENIKKF